MGILFFDILTSLYLRDGKFSACRYLIVALFTLRADSAVFNQLKFTAAGAFSPCRDILKNQLCVFKNTADA